MIWMERRPWGRGRAQGLENRGLDTRIQLKGLIVIAKGRSGLAQRRKRQGPIVQATGRPRRGADTNAEGGNRIVEPPAAKCANAGIEIRPQAPRFETDGLIDFRDRSVQIAGTKQCSTKCVVFPGRFDYRRRIFSGRTVQLLLQIEHGVWAQQHFGLAEYGHRVGIGVGATNGEVEQIGANRAI